MRGKTLLIVALSLTLLACGGGGGGGKKNTAEAITNLVYDLADVVYRAGVAITANRPDFDGGPVDTWEVAPALPAGLTLDPVTGRIEGTPAAEASATVHTVTATNALGADAFDVTIAVTPALPAAFRSLDDRFAAETFLGGLSAPVKMAFTPDGRLFFNELTTGNVRVVDAAGNLLATPFTTVSIATGAEKGLLGLAVAPDFATSGHVFVYATTPAGGGKPERNRVLRYTAVGDVGTLETVIVDDIPRGSVHNAGDLVFGPDDLLYVSVGDTGDSGLSQTDDVLPGRILRFMPDGSIPATNPDPTDPEWCRGLRNSFDMAFHPVAGGLFASENGPAAQDELNFIQAGKNYEWETLPPGFPGNLIGSKVTSWTPVIAPTGICFLTDPALGADVTNNMLVCGYVENLILRLELSGPQFTDLDDELEFCEFVDAGVNNRPLDILQGPDGAIYVSTFTAIYRITRLP